MILMVRGYVVYTNLLPFPWSTSILHLAPGQCHGRRGPGEFRGTRGKVVFISKGGYILVIKHGWLENPLSMEVSS